MFQGFVIPNPPESDNPGSTDSEVRKILTLHIPITEYDTLGSESDNEMTSRAVNQATATATAVAKYRAQQRAGGIDPHDETSSSSETSPPSISRKPKAFPSRKSGKSGANATKRHVRSSSGYSSHNEETTFRYKKRKENYY